MWRDNRLNCHDALFVSGRRLPYDPESEPLTVFPTDQLTRLNPVLLAEINQITEELAVQVEANSNPPSIDVMETYYTCLDSGEWNTSCHLKMTFLHQVCPTTVAKLI
ncbi:unnamed protein product [Protopolystoma xenopodis]|uniref:Uncharacterized protein n=1 Tax=Protopolystoma xenopodis TaxID=117903 RepID=A0A3S5BBY8_9PLAT|nr:unnamed protein product [Protopolystoma xenopodis]